MGFDFGLFWGLNFCEIKVFEWIFCMILFSLARFNIVFLENTNNVKKKKKKKNLERILQQIFSVNCNIRATDS